VPGRLTISFTANQNNQENVDTISAVTTSGLVSEGITRPNLQRRFNGDGQLQVSDSQALHFSMFHNLNRQENQGIGGTTLRERARSSEGRFVNGSVRSLTQISPETVLDLRVNYTRQVNENQGSSRAVAIDVKDAFQGGGATNFNEGVSRTTRLNSLLIRYGDRVTFKTGFDLQHYTDRSLTEDGFNGEFEFASLDDFAAGIPTTYTVSTGEPLLEFSQIQGAAFVQNDVRVSSRMTLMFGLRYEAQTNISDWNNIDPRFGYAFAVNNSTVIRGGLGLFHGRLFTNTVEGLLRLDGTHQQELVVRNPSFPNPFLSGETEVIPPSSIRVLSADLENPSEVRAQVSLERQLPGNIQATLSYSLNRSSNQYRSVNINAPRPGETERPDQAQGNILELQSTGRETEHVVELSVQQRLSFMTISGNYEWNHERNDSQGAFSLPMDNYDLAADWARSNTRIHQFNASVNAQMPLGIFLTVGIRANSGQPYTITTGRDDNNDTRSTDRPVGVARNSEIGPGFQSTTVNLSKAFFLRRSAGAGRAGGAGTQVNVFANITNALNRTNLQNVSGRLTSSRFGQPTRADDPREIEIGIRFQF
jgi:outer membrane receptor for ferrienterochelin and colicin